MSGVHTGITLTNAPALIDGSVYTIAYNVTDLAGNNSATVTNTSVTYDVSVPVISATAPITGSFVKDAKVSYTLSEAALSGTITWTQMGGTFDPASPQTKNLAGAELNSGAHTNINLTNAPTLVDGAIYVIDYAVTDLAGNNSIHVTNTNVTYDVTLPVITATAPLTGAIVNSSKVSYTLSEPALSGAITWTRTGGTADGTIHTQALIGVELGTGAHTNIALANAPILVDGAIYSIAYNVTDLAGNASATVTNTNVTYDASAPVITATAPVSGSFVKDSKVSYTLSEAALSGAITWTRTGGTADPASPQAKALSGAELNTGAHANITLTNAPALVDGTIYSVAYDVTDLAGNSALIVTNTNVTYDVSAPIITATAPVNGAMVNSAKVSYTLSEAALSGTITWTRTGGTVDGTIHTQTLTGSELASGVHTAITLSNNPTLVDGAVYSISYDVTDLAGNAAVTVINTNVTYDATLPVISATAPVAGSYVKDTKVSYTLSEAALSGSITWTRTGGSIDGTTHVQALTGAELNAGVHANIALTNSPTLVDGAIYTIAYDMTDLAGNNAVTVTNTSVTYDVSSPVISSAAPVTGSFVKDTKVSYILSEAAQSGTITWTRTGGTADGTIHTQTLVGPELNVGAHTNITLTNAAAIVDGTVYSIIYDVIDLAGNAAVTVTNTNVTYDVTLPVISATAPVNGALVNNTRVSYTLSETALSGTITWTRTGGTVDGTVHTQALIGLELNSGAHTNITLTNAPVLVDGAVYSISYNVIDLAGNISAIVTNTGIAYDASAPVISGTAPVTGSFVKDSKVSYTLSEAAQSGTITWTRTGGTADVAAHTQILVVPELNAGAHANITLTNAPTLVDGTVYSIAFDVTDLAGNNAVTVTNTNVTYDVSAPVITATAPVNGAIVGNSKVSYTLSETALSGTITWTRTSGTVDGTIHTQALTGSELNSGAHTNITIANAPVLVDGAVYSIAYDVTDLAGNNSATITNTNITYDASAPVVSVTTPVTGSFVNDTKVSYTLSEAALSGTITWTRSGGSTDGTIHSQALMGAELNAGAHTNITLTNVPALVDGAVYSIAYNVTDLAGNNSATVTNTSVTYDVSAPLISATTPVNGAIVNNTRVSYTLSETALSGTITWTRTGGSSDGTIHTQVLTGAELASGVHTNITLISSPTLVDGAIYTISYDATDLAGNAAITVTNTNVTYDVAIPVISATAPVTGSFVNNTKVSYTLSETALSGTITWTRTGGSIDGTIHTQALIGAELASGAHTDITLTNAPTLVDGTIYSIAYIMTDLAGNSAVPVTNTNITYDISAPIISAASPVTGSFVKDTKVSYTLSEPALSGAITWTRTGGVVDGTIHTQVLTGAELNSGAHSNIILTNAPTLVDGAIYAVAFNVTDLAGNSAVAVTTTNITYDVSGPVITATAPMTGAMISITKVSYTLSEAAQSGTITWTRTGGSADATIHTQALVGSELNSGSHTNFTLTNAPILVDGAIYSIAYDMTDFAGNAATTVTNTNITYDATAPVISAVAPVTGSFVKDTKVSYTLSEAALSGTILWTRTGGTLDGIIHNQALVGAELTASAHTNITLTNAPTLVDGAVYSMAYSITDLAGNSAAPIVNNNVTYDLTVPIITGAAPATGAMVSNAKVSYILSEAASSGTITWTCTGGTVDGTIHVQALVGAELNSGAYTNITLTNSPILVDGAIYSIDYNVNDLAGNAAITVTRTNIICDISAPVISATTPVSGSIVKDTRVSYTLSESALSGTITWTRTGGTVDGIVHTQNLIGTELASGTHTNIILTNLPALVDGAIYTITYNVTDHAGNAAVTVTNTNITYDISAPVISATAPSISSFVNNTKVSYTLSEAAQSGTITWTRTSGALDGSVHLQVLIGAELNAGAHTNITLTNAPTLVDGAIYSIAYDMTDIAGNDAVTITNSNVSYDIRPPIISATSPITGAVVQDAKVTYALSEAAKSGTITWTRTGGIADAVIHTQLLSGAELNSGVHANITLTNAPTLVDGAIYSISYDVIDLAGNAATTVTNTNVIYDESAPVISATAPITGSFVNDTKVSYTLSEAAQSGTITWTRMSGAADATVHVQALVGTELNAGAHTNILLTNAPTLVDGAIYSIAYNMTDLAGNNATIVNNTAITYDVSVPVISATAPVTGTIVNNTKVSYTLSEAALSGAITWTRTSGTADGTHSQTLMGAELTSGVHTNITLTNAPVLIDGAVYSISYNVTDLAGNNAAFVMNTGITYDASAPVITATAPISGTHVKDTKVSYTLSEVALSGTITWTRTGGTADAALHTQVLTGAELNAGVNTNILLANAPILVDGAVYSMAYDVMDLAGNNSLNITNTNITYDVSAPIITATSPLTGAITNNTKVSYTLSEAALSGTITWIQTGGSVDGSIHVQALAGAELAMGVHSNIALANAPALVDGAIYSMAFDATDLAGNASVTVTNNNITYDVAVPVISATAPLTGAQVNDTKVSYTLSETAMSGTITWTRTGGTIDPLSHIVSLVGTELNSGAHTAITLSTPPVLVDGAIYSISFNATDAAGNAAVMVTNTNVTYDITTQFPILSLPVSASIHNNVLPIDFTLPEAAQAGSVKMVFTRTSGAIDANAPHVVVFSAGFEGAGHHTTILNSANLSNNADVASVNTDPNDALVDGAVYNVAIQYQDALGNPLALSTNNNITYDITAPIASATAPINGSSVNNTKVSYTLSEDVSSGTVTWTQTGGTADPSSPHNSLINVSDLTSGAHASVVVANPPVLVDGAVYFISYDFTDLAGNNSTRVTNTNIIYDITLPVISGTAPVTNSYVNDVNVSYTLSEPALSGSITWTRIAGSNDPAVHIQSLAGTELLSGAHNDIALSNMPVLVDGAVYTMSFDVIDIAGNHAVTVSNANITYDMTVPVVSSVLPATNSYVNNSRVSYTLSEAASSGIITWARVGGTADPNAHVQPLAGMELSSGIHNNIMLANPPTLLVDGTVYAVSFSFIDLAGNIGPAATNTGITFDLTPPVISNMAPISSSIVNNTSVSYTLSETALSGTITWTRTGGTIDGTIHTQTLTGLELSSGAHNGIMLTNNPVLVNGAVYSITFNITDLSGNASAEVFSNNVTYDVGTLPVILTAPASASIHNSMLLADFTLSESAFTGSVKMTFARTSGTTDANSPHIITFASGFEISGSHATVLNGSDLSSNPDVLSVNSNPNDVLVDGALYSVTMEYQDVAGNPAATVVNNGMRYDLTAPVISVTAPSTGSIVNNRKVSYTLSEGALSGSITYLWTSGTADPTSPHISSLTGSELASGAHTSITLADQPVLLDGAFYTISFSVSDTAGNNAVVVTNTNIKYDITAPVLTNAAPLQDSRINNTKVSYNLSETAASGTITWTRTGGTVDPASPYVIPLSGMELASGAHTDITLASSPSLVQDAVYSIGFVVTDVVGNSSVPVVNTMVTYDTVTQPPLFVVPDSNKTYGSALPIDFTLPEAAKPGTVKLAFTRKSGTPDIYSPQIITFASGFETPVRHVTVLDGKDLSIGANVVSVNSDPNDALVEGTVYDVSLEYQDLTSNSAANIIHSNLTIDISAPVNIALYPKVDSVGGTMARFLVKTNENGLSYFVVLNKGVAAPNSVQVKAGTNGTGSPVAPNLSGHITLHAGIQDTINVSNLLSETDYEAYIVSEDTLLNLGSAPDKLAFTTSDITPPAGVTNFKAKALLRDSIALSWTSSVSPDADSIRILYRTDRFPANDTDGVVAFKHLATITADTIRGLNDSTWFYFSAFVIDKAGNKSVLNSATKDSALTPDTSNHNAYPVLSGINGDSVISFVRYHDGSGMTAFMFTIKDSTDSLVSIGLEYKNGLSWIKSTNVSGDTGLVAVSDTAKRSITWNALKDLGIKDSIYSIRLIADDKHVLRSRDTLTLDSIQIDTKGPTALSASIIDSNGWVNDKTPQVTVVAMGADSVAIALTDTELVNAKYVAYGSTIKAPAFLVEGLNRVVVSFKDTLGNKSAILLRDSTRLDTTLPVLLMKSPKSNARWLYGTTRTLSWKAVDSQLVPLSVKVEYRENSGTWQSINDSLADSGLISWLIPHTTDSNVVLKVVARDKAGNIGSDTVAAMFVGMPGVPLSLTLSPDKASITMDSTLQFTVFGVDADSNFIRNSDLTWNVTDGLGMFNATPAGLFKPAKSGIGRVTATYRGVSDTTDTIAVFYDILLDSGSNNLTKYLTLKFPFNPESSSIVMQEHTDMADFAKQTGFSQISPAIDFSGSSPMKYADSFTFVINLDSLKSSGVIKDTSLVRIFRFNKKTKAWEVVFGVKPDSRNTLRYTCDSLGTFIVGVDTVPPVITDHSDSTSFVDVGTLVGLSGLVNENISNKQIRLYYRRGGDALFDSAIIQDTLGGGFKFNVSMSDRGLEYYMVTDDGTYIRSTFHNNVRVRETDIRSPAPYIVGQWKLFSVPAELACDSLKCLFESWGKYKVDWRLYEWKKNAYVESGDSSNAKVEPGKAYWLKTKKGGKILSSDSGYNVSINKPFTIVLERGIWTAISIPFKYKVSWDAIMDSTGKRDLIAGPYTYNDSNWTPPFNIKALQPWEGYYVKNLGVDTIILRIPSIEYKESATKAFALGADSMNMQLEWEVRTDKGRDCRNYFGVISGVSTEGYDYRVDAIKPPEGLDKPVSTYFSRPGYGAGKTQLQVDFSKFAGGGATWTAEAANLSPDKGYDAAINGLSNLPDKLKVYIVDPKRNIRVNMKSQASYHFTADKGEGLRKITILAGDEQYILNNSGDAGELPRVFSLSENYPNPFNPVTTIHYTIPETGKGREAVSLVIYDIRGKLVRTLLNVKQESGYYSVKWNGCTDKGNNAGSGIYFYRMSVGHKYQKTVKMVLAK